MISISKQLKFNQNNKNSMYETDDINITNQFQKQLVSVTKDRFPLITIVKQLPEEFLDNEVQLSSPGYNKTKIGGAVTQASQQTTSIQVVDRSIFKTGDRVRVIWVKAITNPHTGEAYNRNSRQTPDLELKVEGLDIQNDNKIIVSALNGNIISNTYKGVPAIGSNTPLLNLDSSNTVTYSVDIAIPTQQYSVSNDAEKFIYNRDLNNSLHFNAWDGLDWQINRDIEIGVYDEDSDLTLFGGDDVYLFLGELFAYTNNDKIALVGSNYLPVILSGFTGSKFIKSIYNINFMGIPCVKVETLHGFIYLIQDFSYNDANASDRGIIFDLEGLHYLIYNDPIINNNTIIEQFNVLFDLRYSIFRTSLAG